MILHQDCFESFDGENGIIQFVTKVPTIATKMDGQAAKNIFDQQQGRRVLLL